MKVIFHPEAKIELKVAREESLQYGIETNSNFASETDRVMQQILRFPQSGSRVAKVRRCVFSGFPYSMIYKVYPDHLFVIALAHASRRPGYWRKRLTKK